MNPEQIKTLAEHIRQFLIFNGMWTEVEIYFNESKFTTYDKETKSYYYNDINHLICIKNTASIEAAENEFIWIHCKGEFLDCMNNLSQYGSDINKSIQEDFQKILSQYNLHYKIKGNWLTCYADKTLDA